MAGLYFFDSGELAIRTSAHSALDGFFWLLNPLAGTLRIRSMTFQSQAATKTEAAAATRISLERMTFTGTPTGSIYEICKGNSTMPVPAFQIVQSSSGIIPQAGPRWMSFFCFIVMTGGGGAAPFMHFWFSPNGRNIELLPGEGVVCRQADAGVTNETRVCSVGMLVEE